jgi:hypothetical protein
LGAQGARCQRVRIILILSIYITLEKFNELVLRIVDAEIFPVREIPLLFNLSIKLQIDEINSERHFMLFFPEFLEALSRVIDKNFKPKNTEEGENKIPDEHLVIKMEKMLQPLIRAITSIEFKQVKEKFHLPIKDSSTGLYTIDATNPFYQNFGFIQVKIED